MSKSIKKLSDDLTILNTKIQDLADNLQSLYKDYFQNFSTIVNRQLVLATYQVCTQKYPDSFLRLSYQERMKLQEKIRTFNHIFIQDFIDNLKSIECSNNQFIQSFYRDIFDFFSSLIVMENDDETSLNQENNQKKYSNNEDISTDIDINPQDLIKFQINLEDCIEECLMNLSHHTNKYLQNAGILPNKIPSKILEMALQGEENTSIVSGSPNLLSLLIEKEDKSENIDITPITAICLRLTEIEFNNSALNLTRQKITNLLQKLDTLDEEYQKITRQYAIAQAESAWRSSWVE
ncbi:hypothetical protein GM3708_485 [Geminocystis sp. NIES-3708]|uniref:hypothetical protein n=1 Tax=Geminocystis sp. NIES-3708 TaxID=1615909 RepID=UPI0005FC674C|nr:hypothetical protein [Geminocystis sp. NIES-3708]BAQ60079.1 hypothetical protein GM3708_485 [Geminocystis sp. NIES-3708]